MRETYNNQLLDLTLDLADRILPAFDTPTGIPYGTVNLKYGVPPGETTITSTAGGGTFVLEWGLLSRLTGDDSYEYAARNALRALWSRRSSLSLLGNHIDIYTGEWTHKDAGIGASVDSFYEYLLKAALMFGDEEYLDIFHEGYHAINVHMKREPWYIDVHMSRGVMVWPVYNSLQSFWPGLQTLYGDITNASKSLTAFYSVWRKYGFVPEGFNLVNKHIQPGQTSYPLRPEITESAYYMYRATHDPWWLAVGRDMILSIESNSKCACGYATVEDVDGHILKDHMESFFLSETLKYLYLLFDEDNIMHKRQYIFNTEGHLLPMYRVGPDLMHDKDLEQERKRRIRSQKENTPFVFSDSESDKDQEEQAVAEEVPLSSNNESTAITSPHVLSQPCQSCGPELQLWAGDSQLPGEMDSQSYLQRMSFSDLNLQELNL
eukprot:TRINITY_DN12703_c0_g1_i1.p1 TRINITY_DN12703_c0_g1~~TRINITY_DN12703_c0_g1_i1.p1  ORF type:complete len:451 (-),score=87.58 TRINITY_DN12703_c0_g1_i1:36-1340(-)